MKKTFLKSAIYFISLVLLCTSMVSCNNETDEGYVPTLPEYTVIYIGTAGGNLDFDLLYELYNAKDGFGSKVQFGGIIKPSASCEEILREKNLGGTRYFELTENAGVNAEKYAREWAVFKERYGDTGTDSIGAAEVCELFFSEFKNSRYSGREFKLYDPQNLAQCIKDVAKKLPAQKYILLTAGHGSGWTVSRDALVTRAQLFDDNIEGTPSVSVTELVSGIKQSGIKIRMLFTDLCLMANLENMSEMADACDFLMASSELTLGAELKCLGKRLALCGSTADDETFFNTMKKYISNNEVYDFSKSTEEEVIKSGGMTSIGIYNMKKTPDLMKAVSDITFWYIKNYRAKQAEINRAVLQTVCCGADDVVSTYKKRIDLYRALGTNRIELTKSLANDGGTEFKRSIKTLSDDEVDSLATILDSDYSPLYVFNDFVSHTLSNIGSESVLTQDLSTYYNSYMNTLKNMSYIKCEMESTFDAYTYCAPSITLYSMSQEGFVPFSTKYPTTRDGLRALKSGRSEIEDFSILFNPIAKKYQREAVVQAYRLTDFDQTTRWSTFLEMLSTTPSPLVNSCRTEKLMMISGY